MGWIIAIFCLIGYCINGNVDILIAAGLFAIAGAIGLKQVK